MMLGWRFVVVAFVIVCVVGIDVGGYRCQEHNGAPGQIMSDTSV